MARSYRHLDFVMALFITVLLLSNLLSSAKIIDLGVRVGDFAFIVDAGTLVFPISYIFGDILTEVYGYQRSRRVIWFGFIAMALFAVFVWLAGVLPGAQSWQVYSGETLYNYTGDDAAYGDFLSASGLPDDAGQRAYAVILGGVSGLAIASLAAYWMGSFSNSYVMARLKLATSGRWLWSRTIGSTLVGEAVDSTTFIVIAAALGVFPWEIVTGLIITNYVIKVGIEVVFTPLTMLIVQALKKSEGVDVYDYDTNFNPFRLGFTEQPAEQ